MSFAPNPKIQMLGTSIQAPTLIGCLFVKEQFRFLGLRRIFVCAAFVISRETRL